MFLTTSLTMAQNAPSIDLSAHIALALGQNLAPADRLFLEGQVLTTHGQDAAARKAFRRALRLNPKHIGARHALAHSLLQNRQYNAAQYHFAVLLYQSKDEQHRARYRHILRNIQHHKPIGINGQFALLPSSNVNRGTNHFIFDTILGDFVINPDSKAASGVGVQLGLSGYFRHRPRPRDQLALHWDLSGTRYNEADYNNTTGGLRLAYTTITKSGRWSLAPYLRKTWQGEEDEVNNRRGLRYDLTRRLNERHHLNLNLQHEYRDYPDQDHQSGPFNLAALTLHRQIRPELSINAGLKWERSKPKVAHLQYTGRSLSAGLSQTWEGGLHASFGLNYGKKQYVGVYPLTNNARADRFYGLTIAVQHAKVKLRDFVPRLSCSYTRNRSNIAFNDYPVTECQISVARQF